MKRLDINFAPRIQRQAWLDWCVLALGILAASIVISIHLHIDSEVDDLAYKVERLKHALARVEPVEPETPAQSTAQVPEPVWLEMLDQLGLQLGESVTLLSLQMESKSDQMELHCEAKDADAMFSFVARLEESGVLADVALRSHETVRDNPFKPVRFALTAQRRGQP